LVLEAVRLQGKELARKGIGRNFNAYVYGIFIATTLWGAKFAVAKFKCVQLPKTLQFQAEARVVQFASWPKTLLSEMRTQTTQLICKIYIISPPSRWVIATIFHVTWKSPTQFIYVALGYPVAGGFWELGHLE